MIARFAGVVVCQSSERTKETPPSDDECGRRALAPGPRLGRVFSDDKTDDVACRASLSCANRPTVDSHFCARSLAFLPPTKHTSWWWSPGVNSSPICTRFVAHRNHHPRLTRCTQWRRAKPCGTRRTRPAEHFSIQSGGGGAQSPDRPYAAGEASIASLTG